MQIQQVSKDVLDRINICPSLKIGYSKFFNKINYNITDQEIEKHPRIQYCIKLIKTNINKIPFHGFDSLESINKIFAEHFLSKENQYFKKCQNQIIDLKKSPQLYYGIGTVGYILDEHNLGGSNIIRAACLAKSNAVAENHIFQEIQESVDNFTQIGNVNTLDQLFEIQNDIYFIKKQVIPSYYHLQLLAFTNSWRNEREIKKVNKGIQKLFSLKLPSHHLKHKSQIIAPARINLHNTINWDKEFNVFWWFDITKLLILAGYNEKEFILEIKNKLKYFNIEKISKSYYFQKWGAYSGLALEPNWKSKIRKTFDLYYRVSEIKELIKKSWNNIPDEIETSQHTQAFYELKGFKTVEVVKDGLIQV